MKDANVDAVAELGARLSAYGMPVSVRNGVTCTWFGHRMLMLYPNQDPEIAGDFIIGQLIPLASSVAEPNLTDAFVERTNRELAPTGGSVSVLEGRAADYLGLKHHLGPDLAHLGERLLAAMLDSARLLRGEHVRLFDLERMLPAGLPTSLRAPSGFTAEGRGCPTHVPGIRDCTIFADALRRCGIPASPGQDETVALDFGWIALRAHFAPSDGLVHIHGAAKVRPDACTSTIDRLCSTVNRHLRPLVAKPMSAFGAIAPSIEYGWSLPANEFTATAPDMAAALRVTIALRCVMSTVDSELALLGPDVAASALRDVTGG